MAKYSVSFVIRDWINIEVTAPDGETAQKRARKKLNKMYNDDNKIQWVAGKHEYCGFTNMSLINKIPF